MKKLEELFKTYYGMALSLGVLIPGYTFFTNHAPPLFTEITLITSALSLAILIIGIQKKNAKTSNSFGFVLLIASFILLLAYLWLLDFSTLEAAKGVRWQLGFGMQDWSLTPEAIQLKLHGDCPNNSVKALLLCAGFTQDNITLIWKGWSIYAAGYLLIFTFTLSALLWTQGWLVLGRNHLKQKEV